MLKFSVIFNKTAKDIKDLARKAVSDVKGFVHSVESGIPAFDSKVDRWNELLSPQAKLCENLTTIVKFIVWTVGGTLAILKLLGKI